MRNRQPNIENQNVNQTIVIDRNGIQSGQFRIEVDWYPLIESDFERLINSGIGFKEWSKRFLLISLGTVVIISAKLIDFFVAFIETEDKNSIPIEIKKYEWIALLISIGLCLILQVAGQIFKNEKDHLISTIKNYFNAKSNV